MAINAQQKTLRPRPDPSTTGSIGSVLGTIAIAVGVGLLGYYMLDGHSHTCPCGHRWRHLGAFNMGDLDAHTCKRCGTVEWWKDGVPHVFREVLRTPPPKVLPDTIAAGLQELRAVPHLALSSAMAAIAPQKMPIR